MSFSFPIGAPIAVERDVSYHVGFQIRGWDPVWVPDGVYIMLWFGVDVENEPGFVLTERTYVTKPPGEEGDHWGFDINPWESPSGDLPEAMMDSPGTLEIERFDKDGIGDDDGIKGFFHPF